MLAEALAIGGLGMLAAFGLGVAAKVFYVKVDPLVLEIEEALPGANCGGCGFAGCSSAAVAIAGGSSAPNICVGGGPEIGEAIAEIMGVEIVATEPQIAKLGCRYPASRADLKFDYSGLRDCRAAALLAGGQKECPIGCLGLGSCVNACPFDALKIGSDGLPEVDPLKCTGCGTCVRTCPQGIIVLSSVTDRILDEQKITDCHAPCMRACPAGINVPEQLRRTALGDYAGALEIIKERNPLPLICGYICPHPCESACRRNLADQPVAINPLKRFVAEAERGAGKRVHPYQAPPTGRRLAVIGGGVEGLSAAYFLSRLGHEVHIFEGSDRLGGILNTVIPDSRLPREVLDWEIQGVLDLGIAAHTGHRWGHEVSVDGLMGQGFEAVLAATGGWDVMQRRGQDPAPEPGLPGLFLMLPLSLALARGEKVEVGKNVAIIGGGRSALALARQLKAQGAEQVYILWRRDWEKVGLTREEIEAARGEGIRVRQKVRVSRLYGQGGKVSGLSYTDLRPRDASETGERELSVDAVVAAGGRLPTMLFLPDETEGEAPAEGWHTVLPYRDPASQPRGMFDAAEPVGDHRAAVEAVASGRRAAATLHKALTGQDTAAPPTMLTSVTPVLDVVSLDNLMEVPPMQDFPRFDQDAEVVAPPEPGALPSEEAVKAEAKRCLNCGLICYYRTKYH